jgi:DNA-binding MarR family transcriptional regulator
LYQKLLIDPAVEEPPVPTSDSVPETDLVDRVIERWRAERPDLDPSAKEVTGRIVRLNGLFHKAFAVRFGEVGLDEGGFSVVAALRRAGEPYELSPTALNRELLISSGGVTHLLDRLERVGLVGRRPDPDDRRAIKVGLTPAGKAVADLAMAAHAEVEQQLVSGLAPTEREELARLLRTLLLSIDR